MMQRRGVLGYFGGKSAPFPLEVGGWHDGKIIIRSFQGIAARSRSEQDDGRGTKDSYGGIHNEGDQRVIVWQFFIGLRRAGDGAPPDDSGYQSPLAIASLDWN